MNSGQIDSSKLKKNPGRESFSFYDARGELWLELEAEQIVRFEISLGNQYLEGNKDFLRSADISDDQDDSRDFSFKQARILHYHPTVSQKLITQSIRFILDLRELSDELRQKLLAFLA